LCALGVGNALVLVIAKAVCSFLGSFDQACVFVINVAAQLDKEVFALGRPHRSNEKLLFRRIDETRAPHAGIQFAV
jgi:hypothetical protein